MAPALIPALIQGGLGLGQTIGGLIGARKRRKEAEKAARPDVGIMDYYNKSLARYSPNAYKSTYYQQMQNQIGRGLATGIGATQSRRGGLSTIPGLVQGATDASARAAAQAEQMGRQDLSNLGYAARLAGTERDKMNNLIMQRYAQKVNLLNQGLGNIMKGGSSAAYAYGEGSADGGGSGMSASDRASRRNINRYKRNYNPETWASWNAMETD